MTATKPAVLKRLVVPALVLIFAAPMSLSWWLLNYTDVGKNDAAASHGDLIVPPRPLPDVALTSLANATAGQGLHGKWSLVYLHTGQCNQPCLDNLYKMRQLRLASGKYAPRIQRVLVLEETEEPGLKEAEETYFSGQLVWRITADPDMAVLSAFALTANEDPLSLQRLYLVDPLGNLMMSYPADASPTGIIKDLKRLLRYSRIG